MLCFKSRIAILDCLDGRTGFQWKLSDMVSYGFQRKRHIEVITLSPLQLLVLLVLLLIIIRSVNRYFAASDEDKNASGHLRYHKNQIHRWNFIKREDIWREKI